MNKFILYLSLMAVVTGSFMNQSCAEIDGLSDANSVVSFEITQHTPSTIQLGEAEIGDGEIVIPVQYGSDKFPLSFIASVECSPGYDRIEGLDFSQMITLETISDTKDFYVMAESGLARRYVIRARITDYVIPEDIPFFVKSVSPVETKVLGKARMVDDVMTMYVIDPQYPLSLVVLFDVDETAVGFEDFVNGVTKLTFDSADSELHFKLTDNTQDSKRDITLRVAPLRLISGSQENTDIFQEDLKISLTQSSAENFTVAGNRIDNDADSLTIFLTPFTQTAQFPASVNILIDNMGNNIGYIDLGTEVTTFYGFDQPQYFYMVDMQELVARRWKVSASKYSGEGESTVLGADVLDFSYTYTATNVSTSILARYAITLNTSIVYIYPEEGYIWLWMTAYNNTSSATKVWMLTLDDISLTLSEGATASIGEFVWEGNESWRTPKSFEVVSAEGKTKTWHIGVKDGRYGLNMGTSILDVSLREIYPVSALLDYGDPFTINETDKSIIINMKSWDGCFSEDTNGNVTPMRFYLNYTLSEGAHVISQNNNREAIQFNSKDDVQSIEIMSEDETVTDTWSVALSGPDESIGVPNVTSFKFTSLPSSYFDVGKINIDTDNNEVVVTLNSAGSFSATLGYKMGLSRSATASIATEGTYTFDNMNSTMSFTVQNGTEQKNWTVRFAPHTPQLQNWELDNWDGNSPLPIGTQVKPFWAVANYIMNTTTPVTGASGSGYAAQLKTGSILSKLASGSIYLGWFDSSNAIANMNTPIKISFQGMEFAASKKIIGFEADVKYLSKVYDGVNDTGTLTIELIKQTDRSQTYVYHGDDPNTLQPDEDNTAVLMARGQMFLGNSSGTVDGKAVTVVPSDSWTHVTVNLDYSSMSNPLDYTHLSILCASSSKGNVFKGAADSTLTIDNIKLIYEE